MVSVTNYILSRYLTTNHSITQSVKNNSGSVQSPNMSHVSHYTHFWSDAVIMVITHLLSATIELLFAVTLVSTLFVIPNSPSSSMVNLVYTKLKWCTSLEFSVDLTCDYHYPLFGSYSKFYFQFFNLTIPLNLHPSTQRFFCPLHHLIL